MNANSFQLKAAATDGNDVIPKITENAYETTPEEKTCEIRVTLKRLLNQYKLKKINNVYREVLLCKHS